MQRVNTGNEVETSPSLPEIEGQLRESTERRDASAVTMRRLGSGGEDPQFWAGTVSKMRDAPWYHGCKKCRPPRRNALLGRLRVRISAAPMDVADAPICTSQEESLSTRYRTTRRGTSKFFVVASVYKRLEISGAVLVMWCRPLRFSGAIPGTSQDLGGTAAPAPVL